VGPAKIRYCLLIFIFAVMTGSLPALSSEVDSASPRELIEVLKANVYLTGNIATRLAAQERLMQLGKLDPRAVVPLIIKELSPPRSYGKIAGHQRLALIELLRDLGPAAEASTFVLAKILKDQDEPYDAVKMQAAAALLRIGSKEAKTAAQNYHAGLQRAFAASAGNMEASRSLSQNAFLIRQELRRRQPSDNVISSALSGVLVLGPRSASTLPTLLRAYSDPRLGSALHNRIGEAIRAAGVRDVENAARKAAAKRGVPDILNEVIAETRRGDPFVRSLGMIELGRMGPSKPAIDAMISALRDGRNPGDAARVLGNFGKTAEPALPALLRYFDDEVAGPNAIQAVGKIGVKNPAIVAELRRVLRTLGHRHRGQAANTLGRLKAASALPELQEALADGRKYVRILSAKALGQLGPDAAAAVESLAATLDGPDIDLRRAAVTALGHIGEAAIPATERIAQQLVSGDKRLKNSARWALTKIGGPQADIALTQDARRFEDADLAEIRRLAVTDGMKGMSKYLFRLPKRRATPLAHRLLSERQPDNAYVGALFLARQGENEPAMPVLADNLARRADGDKMLAGFAYSMMHSGDETRARTLFRNLARYIEKNIHRYSPKEQARLKAFLERVTGQKQR